MPGCKIGLPAPTPDLRAAFLECARPPGSLSCSGSRKGRSQLTVLLGLRVRLESEVSHLPPRGRIPAGRGRPQEAPQQPRATQPAPVSLGPGSTEPQEPARSRHYGSHPCSPPGFASCAAAQCRPGGRNTEAAPSLGGPQGRSGVTAQSELRIQGWERRHARPSRVCLLCACGRGSGARVRPGR